MPDNPHFQQVPNAQAARRLLTFEPLLPRKLAGRRLQSMSVYLRDHRLRDVPEAERVLEADYDGFGFSQSRPGAEEARRRAFEVRYGRVFSTADVAGHEARVYPQGPEPTPDDIDPRSPAVVTWAHGEMFYFLASGELEADELLRVARALFR